MIEAAVFGSFSFFCPFVRGEPDEVSRRLLAGTGKRCEVKAEYRAGAPHKWEYWCVFRGNEEKEVRMKIRKDMTITEILQINPMIANILMGQGMHCITCEAAYGETLEEACAVHGFDEEGVNTLVEQLNDFIATA